MSERVLGGVGSYVIFENDVVKVWQNDLRPGESSDWHLHTTCCAFWTTLALSRLIVGPSVRCGQR